jgi:hypothetical protein
MMGDTLPSGQPFREAAMPWQEMSPMKQRSQFLTDHQRGLYSMRELCARYGVSRKTGYKWLARYAAEGARGLAERNHAPHVCPHELRDASPTHVPAQGL